MIDNHPGEIKILDPNANTKFKLFDDEHENSGGGGFAIGSTSAETASPGGISENIGGGRAYFKTSGEALNWYING